ncbi:MAG: hypothetical protein LJE59_00765 [Chromatiaceae bacterium]|nr:hypothetical protein [Chromatiaceae bacterium]
MSDLSKKPWYSDGRTFTGKVHRWVSRRNPRSKVGQESQWLGWDGWVITDSDHPATRDTPDTL